MLQQGHDPGKYAAMLRDILRKMSKDDSHVRLKSLEQVLKLGQDIVNQDQDEKKKKQQLQQQVNVSSPISSPVSLPTSPIMANMPSSPNEFILSRQGRKDTSPSRPVKTNESKVS
jgi:hypothetical protein